MRKMKIHRAHATAGILALVLVTLLVLGAATAFAADPAVLTMTPTSGPAGTNVVIKVDSGLKQFIDAGLDAVIQYDGKEVVKTTPTADSGTFQFQATGSAGAHKVELGWYAKRDGSFQVLNSMSFTITAAAAAQPTTAPAAPAQPTAAPAAPAQPTAAPAAPAQPATAPAAQPTAAPRPAALPASGDSLPWALLLAAGGLALVLGLGVRATVRK